MMMFCNNIALFCLLIHCHIHPLSSFQQITIANYGWKGACLIFAAALWQLAVCGAVFRAPDSTVQPDDTENIALLEEERPGPSHQIESTQVNHNPNSKCGPPNSQMNNIGKIYKIGHFYLFKNSTFIIILVVSFLRGTVCEGILLIMTNHLKDIGASLSSSQLILTVYGIGNVFGRSFHYVCSRCVSKDYYVHLAFSSAVSVLTLFYFTSIGGKSEVGVYMTMLFYGFSSGWLYTLIPLIAKYNIASSDFSFAFAWTDCIYGIGACAGIPLIGKWNYWPNSSCGNGFSFSTILTIQPSSS